MIDAANLNALLSRRDVARALTDQGYKTSEATLATLASRGGGPPFQKFGQRAVYRWGNALAWAEARLSSTVASTSELKPLSMSATAAPTATLRGVHDPSSPSRRASLPKADTQAERRA
jgi:hypothetical protein